MEDIKSLAIGILGGLIVLIIAKVYRAYKRKSIRDDIAFIEFEKKHLEEMKRSSVEMNRSSFRAIFTLFTLLGIGNALPYVFTILEIPQKFFIIEFITLFIWALFLGLCIKFWRRYENLKNYKEAVNRMESKIEKLQDKLK